MLPYLQQTELAHLIRVTFLLPSELVIFLVGAQLTFSQIKTNLNASGTDDKILQTQWQGHLLNVKQSKIIVL